MNIRCPSEAYVRAGFFSVTRSLPAMGFAPPALVNGSTRPTIKIKPTFRRIMAFPYGGEGGPLAVDEVPTRAPDFVAFPANRF